MKIAGVKIPRVRVAGVKMPRLKKLNLLRRDPFGNFLLLKRALMGVFAVGTYARLNILNKLKIEGTEHLDDLPVNNVLFISNHQTYYADVIALYHIFCSVKWGFKNSIRFPVYFMLPRVKNFYVAAEETMKDSGFLPRMFSYAGAITVKRSWRNKGQDVQRGPDMQAPDKIRQGLEYGWVVNFPQGTTKPYAPIRKGTAHIIKQFNPIVVPVVINGFRRAFDKKGLRLKKRGTTLSVKFKKPMVFDQDWTVDQIQDEIARLIEQVPPPGLLDDTPPPSGEA
jgi:1-acyl-sn-glycerol-3-phosphate acyltransferase